jgi:hypothetical protein
MASAVGSRLAYEKAKQAIQNAGFNMQTAVLSQSYLRLEVALSTTITNYQFPILVNDVSSSNTTSFATEQRLQLQDAFVCSSLSLTFAVPSSSTATNFPLYTYPSLTTFSASNTASSLYQWYNSSMQITINNRVIVPAYDLYRHYFVPQTQAAANAYYSTSAITLKDQNDGSSSGFYPIEPSWVFVGSKQNSIQVQLPAAMAAVENNSRAVLILRGHLAQNVTSVR